MRPEHMALAKPIALASSQSSAAADGATLQFWRRCTQTGFFLLFLLAPALNLLRFDLNETQLWFLGMRWSLGIDEFMAGRMTGAEVSLAITLRAIVPVVLLIGTFLTIAYRWGRLYCGWLCPHFSVVESLNRLMHKASGKFSLWDSSPTARAGVQSSSHYWPVFALACVLMGFAWAITLLTYLLPPAEVWGNLVDGSLTANQTRFLVAATTIFTLEFTLARHLFCRFGCAVGYFQSVAWMANPRAMVVAFSRDRARECKQCDLPRGSACDSACPMRLNPRNIKRMMFSCVQCGQCISACDQSQSTQGRTRTLEWKVGLDALRETLHQRRHDAGEQH
ncbi:4Fe-4S binding protein [Curvibacter sp. APW13]|uniref:4Fe-4S binding protein n=1 Tax=Curvibacter sp. APW13 TaxID=3077236 RepID=UPI0028DFB0AF|nr:4Fe-4S binding protein [Curvibacter sp. APW13]MDT8991896.1 4Fe-4S binding protein [Curvibacter sp. APW13]